MSRAADAPPFHAALRPAMARVHREGATEPVTVPPLPRSVSRPWRDVHRPAATPAGVP